MEAIDFGTLIGTGGPYSLLGLALTVAWRFFSLYQQSTEKRIEEAGSYKVALLDVTNKLALLTEGIKGLTK